MNGPVSRDAWIRRDVAAPRGLGHGFSVGHWTDREAATGCTVVLPPRGNVASCEVRGSSPSTRELEHLHPDRRLTEIHALVLTGGSAFGLAAADGVVDWLEKRGIGYETPRGPVPIVPAAVVFDLGMGSSDVRPHARSGWDACEDAREDGVERGRVGAGTGCTVGKWAGFEHRVAGGIGIGSATADDATVHAIAVVNAVGDIIGPDGTVLAGTTSPEPRYRLPGPSNAEVPTDTVLAAVICHADLDKRDVRWLAQRGADGITIAVRPAHTRYDGDVVFAIAAPGGSPSAVGLDILGVLATEAVAAAVRDAVA